MENLSIEKRDVVCQVTSQIPGLNFAVSNCDLRASMKFVRIQKRQDSFYAEATNGHILAEINLSFFFGNNLDLHLLPDEFYLKPECFKKLTSTKVSFLRFEEKSLVFKILNKSFETISIIEAISKEEFEKNFGKFPDTSQVWPIEKKSEAVSEIGLNFSLLNDLGKSLIPSSFDNNVLEIRFFGQRNPIVCKPIHADLSENCRGIIMPVLLNF